MTRRAAVLLLSVVAATFVGCGLFDSGIVWRDGSYALMGEQTMSHIEPEEIVIEGRWLVAGGRVEADAAASRIHRLVSTHLVLVAVGSEGWSKLFRDPEDGRLWEHTYPQSGMHGGGPPKLEAISPDKAKLRYPIKP